MIFLANEFPQACTIAGSDSDGSAGMQADLHTFFRRKVYGTAVMTAAVAGNSYGIHDSVTLPTTFIDQEFKDLADDYHVRASKTGMLADSELIRTSLRIIRRTNSGHWWLIQSLPPSMAICCWNKALIKLCAMN